MKLKKYSNSISLNALFYILFSIINSNECDTNIDINKNVEKNGIKNQGHITINKDSNSDENHENILRITKRAATAIKNHLWEDGIIPYQFSDVFTKKKEINLIKKAMKHWESLTCLQFVERDYHPNYIVFRKLPCGCCSFVGKQDIGAQFVSIGPNCTTFGNILHELGHVIGFWHEHSRPDRDNYVSLVAANIPTGEKKRFEKLTTNEINSLGQPYDYDSIMHYSRKFNGLDVLIPKYRPSGKIGQRMHLSDGDVRQTNLLYNCPVCGKTLNESYGAFETSSNEITHKCEWRIHAAKYEIIILNITEYHLILSDRCINNYLQVRDGYSPKSPRLSHCCGTKNISTILTSKSNYLLVKYFKSYSDPAYFGFKANYQAICDHDIYLNTNGQKKIGSPNVLEYYKPNKECIWRIYAPVNYQVTLEFESFHIEISVNCRKDYLEFREGNNSNSELIGRHCGSSLPTKPIQSVGHQLFIKFVSDESKEAGGFSAFVSAETNECKTKTHGCDHQCVDRLFGYYCSCRAGYDLHQDGKTCIHSVVKRLTESEGTIYSPNYPNKYPKNIDYAWQIYVPKDYNIIIRFSHFDLEKKEISGKCNDYVEINDLDKEEETNDDNIFCGSEIPSSILIKSNKAEIFFSTNKKIQKTGFAISYETKSDKCLQNNGGCQHICQNTLNLPECSCYDGFKLDKDSRSCIRLLAININKCHPTN